MKDRLIYFIEIEKTFDKIIMLLDEYVNQLERKIKWMYIHARRLMDFGQ